MSQEEIAVPKGWELTTLDKICVKITDRDHTTPNYTKSGIPLISPKDFTSSGISFLNCKFISKEDHQKNSKRTDLKKGDILFSRIGTVGKTRLVDSDKEFSILHSIVQIRPDLTKISQKFLYYYLQSGKLLKMAKEGIQSVGTPDLGINKIRSFQIILPPIPIQKQIITKLDHILGELEIKEKEILSLIEQNKQRIDFFEKNWINYIISTLIPKKEIPNGWSLLPLSEICNVERGKFGHRPRNDPAFYGGKYPFIQTGDVARSNGRVSKFSQTLNENGFKVSRMFPKGTVVITIAANIGDTAILEFDSCFPDSLIGITPITGKTIAEYVEYALRLYQKDLTRDASQGTQKNINYDFLKPLLIPIPKTITEQENIVRKIKSAEEKFQSQKKQFENIKNNYESKIKYIHHIQSSVLDSAFSGKFIQ
jgi:restriction endonuclease S subunit